MEQEEVQVKARVQVTARVPASRPDREPASPVWTGQAVSAGARPGDADEPLRAVLGRPRAVVPGQEQFLRPVARRDRARRVPAGA